MCLIMEEEVSLLNIVVVLVAMVCNINVWAKNSDTQSRCFKERPSPLLKMFVDELPIPPVLNTTNGGPLTIGAYKITQKLHRDLPKTTLYAFGTSQEDACYPGPTIEGQRWVPIDVTWKNYIEDKEHILPIDYTLNIPRPRHGGVAMVVHLHGGETISYSDGNPDAWFTSQGENGSSFITQTYHYSNEQPPTTLWYHDHTIGMNRLNMAAGLLGLYILRSPFEESFLNLPSGPFEVPLVFQDKRFLKNGQISFPSMGFVPSVPPVWCPDSFGDTMVVNGKVWPFLNIQRRRYRFRMLNGNTERFLHLSLEASDGTQLEFQQIGTDAGYLNQPQQLSAILMGPAERRDVIIDFSNVQLGSKILLNNFARAPFPRGNSRPGRTRNVMQFNVVEDNSLFIKRANPPIPTSLRNATVLSHDGSIVTRTHVIVDVYNNFSSVPIRFLFNGLRWEDPPTELPILGSTEVWEFVNPTDEAHPIHIHLVGFQVLNIQEFDTSSFMSDSCSLQIQYPNDGTCYTQYPIDPLPSMVGWKDTLTIWPGNVTRILVRFAPQEGHFFPFDATERPGYLWHCHLLGHEDNDMMRPMIIREQYHN